MSQRIRKHYYTKSKVVFYYNNRIIHTIMNVTIFKIIKSTVHQAVYFIDLKIYNNAINNVCHYKIGFPKAVLKYKLL